MKIKIIDIPPEGREITFDLNTLNLNQRLKNTQQGTDSSLISPPAYIFENGAHVLLHVSIERTTVFLQGAAYAKYSTLCSRCTENVQKTIAMKIHYVLKPVPSEEHKKDSEINKDQEEDLSLGFYTGKEVDCDSVVEELLILELPYVVLCKETCKGLCSQCGTNLNETSCYCRVQSENARPLAVLKQIKLH